MYRFQKSKHSMPEGQLPTPQHGDPPPTSHQIEHDVNVRWFFRLQQVVIQEEDRHKTTFTTPWGTFEYLRIPFGLLNTGATFQRAMDYVFKDFIGKIIEIYQDNLTAF